MERNSSLVVFCPLPWRCELWKLRRCEHGSCWLGKGYCLSGIAWVNPSSLSMIRRVLPYKIYALNCAVLKVEHGLDLVIVDYIQLMQGRKWWQGQENRQQEVSEISRNLKLIAREFNVPVIALSQLSVVLKADQINGLYFRTFVNLVPRGKMRISLSSCTAINITMRNSEKGTMQKSLFVNIVMAPSVP